jgi:DNA polymerase (family X)
VRLRNGMQMDLRVVPEESFGAALHYFTGSKTHNVAIRDRAKRMGLKVSEWGVFRVSKSGEEEKIGGADELDVFRLVGLPWIPTELRENRGEIEAAERGELPALLELADVRGDVHMHTRESDGAATIEEMAEAGRERGYRYVAITDHSPSLTVARGLTPDRLRAEMAAIDAANAKRPGIRIFKGIEVDILGDGLLDMDEALLGELDVVIASVHSKMSQTKEEMTARVVRAIESGRVDVVGHPTGRILGRRNPFELDMERVLRAAAAHGVAMEINAYPDRLDLSDVHAHMAKERGVKIVIDTDSHSPRHLDLVRWGVSNARRGWLEKADVLNTIEDPDQFLKALHGSRRR